MVSPVDTSVKWARSSMPGAPVLTRAAGSLISLLDALCVDGWGSQTATSVVVSGGFAEATFPLDHAAAPHAVVLVSGVTGTMVALNGEQKITSVKPNKIRWATALVDGTASGTVVVKMPAAGWNKPFSGTNLAVYKSASLQGHGQFLRVNDATAGNARAVGYENMTAVSTGTGPFPTNAQVNGGYYWKKSEATSGTTPIPWGFASDGRKLYLFVQPMLEAYGADYVACSLCGFGDEIPEDLSGDPFATVILGSPSSDPTGHALDEILNGAVDSSVAVPRSFGGQGTAVRGRLDALSPIALTYPNPITGSFTGSPCYLRDIYVSPLRARAPGMLRAQELGAERAKLPSFGIIGGSGPQRAALFVPSGASLGTLSGMSAYLVDITGPWR